VLDDPSFGAAKRAIAADIEALPPVTASFPDPTTPEVS
jgi:hypothetical protein